VKQRRNVPNVDGARTPANSRPIAAMAQQVHVIDRVRAGDHPGDQRRHLQIGVRPTRRIDPDLPRHQLVQTAPLRQRQHRAQPGARHEIRVVEHRRKA
jgi:hypothetical protein